jgi:superfamily I DNA and/or RNA helicase
MVSFNWGAGNVFVGGASTARLLLNFADKGQNVREWNKDFYNKPLEEQYAALTLRYRQLQRFDYKQLVQICFPVGQEKKYYISMPDFLRGEIDEESYINNIVVRSPRDGMSEHVLPPGLEVILIGDIKVAPYGEFIVKGIEFIEASTLKCGECEVRAIAMSAFNRKTFTDKNGRTITVPEYGVRPGEVDTVLTRDFILELCHNYYTVKNPVEALKKYEKWDEYIKFRRYYLDEKGKEGFPFNSCKAATYYIISRRDYDGDPQKYDGSLLPGLDPQKKDEHIVVDKQFDNSEELPLICVTVDKNKKELFAETVKNKIDLPVFEQKLYRFTDSEVTLETADGKKRVYVDDRYRFFHKDIEPDYSGVEAEFAKKLRDAYSEIDGRYGAMLKQQVDEYIGSLTEKLTKESENKLADFATGLANNIEKDIAENNDKAVKEKYADAVKSKEAIGRERLAGMEKSYVEKIAAAKKSKEKNSAETVKTLEAERQKKHTAFEAELSREKSLISLRSLYEARNKELVERRRRDLVKERQDAINKVRMEKNGEIRSKQEPEILAAKEDRKRENIVGLAAKKAEMKENETVRRYFVYLKLRPDDTPDSVNNDIGRFKPSVFKCDQTAERVKIDRQCKALNNFFNGYVKNPFLSTYLFSPHELGAAAAALPECDYFSQRLNDGQKEAVRKAVASESIFLLQGPPGTGKTEVIAEIAAQFVRRGRRVLISSETHKAIDNVFERLPKIPSIRPLRLIPSMAKKEPNPYSPERLTDNFYLNISDRIDNEVERFKNFSKRRDNFEEEYKRLNIEFEKLNREKKNIDAVRIKLDAIKRERESLVKRQDAEEEKLRVIAEEKNDLEITMRRVDALNLDGENKDLEHARKSFLALLGQYHILRQDMKTLAVIRNTNMDKINEEITMLSGNQVAVLEAERAKIKMLMNDLRDPETDDIIIGQEQEYKRLQNSFIAKGKEISAAKNNTGVDFSDLVIGKIVDIAFLSEDKLNNTLNTLPDTLLEIKNKLIKYVEETKAYFGKGVDKKTAEYNAQKTVIDELKTQIRDKDKESTLEKEKADYDCHEKAKSAVKDKITAFFKDFDINKPYENLNDALEIIKEEWSWLESSFEEREQENREKIPMYERILKFLRGLQSDGSIENDRKEYTKTLFENANVFGLTCTSRENFKAASVESFAKYAIDGLDVKKQGIDVVIIDEVSRSSFLDLLIPILYGKTVILVGDHRQLPPMYDLRHLRKDAFDGLKQEIINYEKNKEYTDLYEECFFKTLFENVPDRLRVTLKKQYRCHEDIMRVFNHFYGDSRGRGSLEIGMPNQNDQKQHGLTVKGKNGRRIVEPDKHIYFVDCGNSYERFGESTSATNEIEAKVVIEFAKRIDAELGRSGKFEIDKERGKDDRKSMGVICTYSDQARLIKRGLKKNMLKNINELNDEYFIVSTVDDFQGDERDIVFVSMVRNPEPKKRKNALADFIRKFERINVAFSRARRMLVIVGAKDFLSEAVIDLPDMSGNKALDKKAYPVYREIINTISTYGLLLKAEDIITEGGR